jgi:hypothetical protein
MKQPLNSKTGRIAPLFLLPLGILLLCTAGAQLLPDTDAFDFIRGLTTGALTAIALVTVVGIIAARRRAVWRAEKRTLDDLEPLGPSAPDGETDTR